MLSLFAVTCSVLLILLAGGVAACGGDDNGDENGQVLPPPPEPTPPPESPAPAALEDSPSWPDIQTDVGVARNALESFWRRILPEAFNRSYDPVANFYYYDGADPTKYNLTFCGGDPPVSNNAFYCSGGDFIAYDGRWFLAANDSVGDSFLYFVIAHEWGHAIQNRVGGPRIGVRREVQADCYAGAFVGDSLVSGSVTWEEGDADEIIAAIFSLRDEPGTPWFDPGAHGSAGDRTRAYYIGVDQGAAACFNRYG